MQLLRAGVVLIRKAVPEAQVLPPALLARAGNALDIGGLPAESPPVFL
jgi:hypothetical protein